METHLNMMFARKLWDDYARDNLLCMCKNMIIHHLLKNGVQFQRNKKIFEPALDISDAFEEYWEPFISDALDSALCLGLVVVKINTDGTKRNFPTVVRPHLYDIHYRIVNNIYEYWISSTYIDIENVLIYSDFSSHALPSGEVVSPVARVMDKCRFLKQLRYTTLIMEKNKSNPDYFAEVQESSNRERHEGVDYDFYADASEGDSAAGDLKFERSKVNVDILLKQQELYNQYRGSNSKQVKNLQNITQLPNGQRIVPTSQNTGRQDITQIHKVLQEEICAGMGVPRSLMIGDSLYKSDIEGVTDSFKHTILGWKKTLGKMCTDIYQKAYVDTTKLKVYKNIYASKIKHQIKVVFPVHPYVSSDELDYLYRNGVIGWDIYSKYCLQNTSISDHFREKKAPVSNDSDKVNMAEIPPLNTKRKRSTR